MKVLIDILEDNGFDTIHEDYMVEIRHDRYVNPADIRVKVAELLSQSGFENYNLKEVYFYTKAKKPYRTDATGYVEFVEGDDFVHNKKIKFKETRR